MWLHLIREPQKEQTNKQQKLMSIAESKTSIQKWSMQFPSTRFTFAKVNFYLVRDAAEELHHQEPQMPSFTYLVDIMWWKWTTIEVSCFICECQLWVKWYPQDNDSRMQVQNVPCKRQYYFQNNSETFLQQRRFTCPRFKTEPLGISKITNFCFLCWFVCSFVYFLFFCEI